MNRSPAGLSSSPPPRARTSQTTKLLIGKKPRLLAANPSMREQVTFADNVGRQAASYKSVQWRIAATARHYMYVDTRR